MWAHRSLLEPLEASRGLIKQAVVGSKAEWHIGAGWKHPTRPEVIYHDDIALGTSRKHWFEFIWASGGLWGPAQTENSAKRRRRYPVAN